MNAAADDSGNETSEYEYESGEESDENEYPGSCSSTKEEQEARDPNPDAVRCDMCHCHVPKVRLPLQYW